MTNLGSLFQLVYISEAVEDLSYSDLENILKTARLKNLALNITGILIHREGFFIQLLEGPKDHVKEVMSKIIKDRRHKNLRIIHEWDQVQNRFFTDWSMSFLDGDLATHENSFIQKQNDFYDIIINPNAFKINWLKTKTLLIYLFERTKELGYITKEFSENAFIEKSFLLNGKLITNVKQSKDGKNKNKNSKPNNHTLIDAFFDTI